MATKRISMIDRDVVKQFSIRDKMLSDENIVFDLETGGVYKKKTVHQLLLNFLNKHLALVHVTTVIAGICVGVLCRRRTAKYTKREVMYVGYLGNLYIRMLQCTTFPLFTTSILTAFGHLSWKSAKKIVLRTFSFFLLTLVMSGTIGAIIMFSLQPGTLAKPLPEREPLYLASISIYNYVLDIMRNVIPSNIIEACMFTYRTEFKPIRPHLLTATSPVMETEEVLTRGTNYLGLVVVASALGISFSYMGAAVKVCLAFAEALNQLCINLTHTLLLLSPPGMFCVAVSQVLEVEDFTIAFVHMGWALAAVLIGLLIHTFITQPIVYYLFTRMNAFHFYWQILPAIATTWATSSTIATIPISLYCLENHAEVSHFTARFIIPLGANLNQGGSTMYVFMVPCFLAQSRNLDVSPGQYAFAWFMAMFSTIAAPGIPGASLQGMKMVMSVLGVTGEDFAWIEMMDPLLERCCTAVNVLGDCIAAAYIDRTSQKEVLVAELKEKMVEDFPRSIYENQPTYGAAAYFAQSRRQSLAVPTSLSTLSFDSK